jgi:hypothetical protein
LKDSEQWDNSTEMVEVSHWMGEIFNFTYSLTQCVSWTIDGYWVEHEISSNWTQRFICVITDTCPYTTMSWASWIQLYSQPVCPRSIWILSSHLCLVSQLVSFLEVSQPKLCMHFFWCVPKFMNFQKSFHVVHTKTILMMMMISGATAQTGLWPPFTGFMIVW